MSRSKKKPNPEIEETIELDAELVAKCRIDPVVFAKIFCKFYPHWYQSAILRDFSQNISIRMGRQMGKTSSIAIFALWYAYNRPDALTPHQKVTVVIIAPSQRQSKIMYDQIRAYIHANPLLESSVTKSTLDRIELDNNSVIHNFPVGDSAEKVRGFSIDMLIVDEAAYIKDRVYTAVLPSLASTNGRLVLIGTPAARVGMFYQAFYPQGSGPTNIQFSTHWYPYSDALDVQKFSATGVPLFDGEGDPVTQLSKNWIEYQMSTMPAGAFAQEYEARFTDDSLGYFNRNDILANAEDYPMEFMPDGKSIYSMGVDFAKYRDSYVALVVKRPPDGPMRIVYLYEQKKRDYSETVAKTIEIAKRFNCQYIYCDSTGVGEPNVEIIRNGLRGISKVEGVNMTSLDKQNDMYANVSRLFGEGMLKVPLSARELITQLSMVMRTVSPQGKPKIEAAGGHGDDFPDALALACMVALSYVPTKIIVSSAPSVYGKSVSKKKQLSGGERHRQQVVLDQRGRPIGTRALKRRRR
jgi:hypothetical protein